MSEVQDNLNQYLEEQEKTEKDSFKVDDDSKANWALRKIKQAQEKQEKASSLAVEEQEKIEAWYQSEKEKAQREIDFFQGLLAQYAFEKRKQDPKFKSQTLPNGRIKFQKKQAQIKYKDKDIIDYLEKNEKEDLIKVKKEPAKSEIKKAFTIRGNKMIDPDTGEVVDCVTVELPEDEFKVEVDK